ncbi:MAG TPA: ABC-2 transporter permease [Tenericutes bacterium]|nr:ABC-2 transporter permease [Mycoplasmatota bacterium]
MNSIKGLLIKDLLQLKSYKKNFILSTLIYLVLIILESKNSNIGNTGPIMIMFLFSIYAMATFNYDEKSKSDRYILTLPLTRREIILSKYVFCISSVLIGAFFGTIIGILIPYLINNIKPNFDSISSTLLGGMVALSFIQSIQIPYIYKYGAEKGRLQIYLVMMVIVIALTLIYMLVPEIDLSFLDIYSHLIPIIGIILILLNYFVSFKISCKIYNKKEV